MSHAIKGIFRERKSKRERERVLERTWVVALKKQS